ncbi:MAG: SDR family oxidoreductase [Chloroflexi bacterium]|nr:SDR family oxidoreductase [Chloroflexota bacterium]
MGDRLRRRNAAVTGAGRGIGRAVAIALAEEGANVVVNDPGVNVNGTGFDQGPAEQVAEEIRQRGGNAVASYDSVATAEGGESIVRQCAETFGRIDIVINVAGILRDRMIFNMTEEEWDAVIAVHLKGHFNTTRPASILMRQQRYGRIVNFSSVSGLRGNSGQANYGAAKAGVAGFTRVVARDLGRYGITVNCIAPGAITRMTETVPEAARALRVRRAISQARTGAPPPVEMSPEHIAPIVVYLCSDEAWNINGKIFHVAGGNVSLAAEETPLRQITKDGLWTLDELATIVPSHLMYAVVNPAPPPDDLEIPGRPRPPQEARA